jgi:hypothetical protein
MYIVCSIRFDFFWNDIHVLTFCHWSFWIFFLFRLKKTNFFEDHLRFLIGTNFLEVLWGTFQQIFYFNCSVVSEEYILNRFPICYCRSGHLGPLIHIIVVSFVKNCPIIIYIQPFFSSIKFVIFERKSLFLSYSHTDGVSFQMVQWFQRNWYLD